MKKIIYHSPISTLRSLHSYTLHTYKKACVSVTKQRGFFEGELETNQGLKHANRNCFHVLLFIVYFLSAYLFVFAVVKKRFR